MLAQRKIDWVIPTLGIGMFVMGIWVLADGLIVWGRRLSSPRAYALACIGSINGIFDYSENALIAQAMRAGPDALNSTSIKLASICTTLKFTFGSISIVLIFVLAVFRWAPISQQYLRQLNSVPILSI